MVVIESVSSSHGIAYKSTLSNPSGHIGSSTSYTHISVEWYRDVYIVMLLHSADPCFRHPGMYRGIVPRLPSSLQMKSHSVEHIYLQPGC